MWHQFFFGAICSCSPTPTAKLFVQPRCSGVTPLETLERIRPRQLEMERVQMMTGCKLTLSRKVRKRAKVKNQHQRGIRTTSTTNTSNIDINTCKNCCRTGHRSNDCWRPSGGAYDYSTSNNSYTQKGKSHKKGKGKSKHVGRCENESAS